MDKKPPLPGSRDKVLFTPGPLTTSLNVKKAMLHDAGSWHWEFNAKVTQIRENLLKLAGVSRDKGWEAILLQGSGTFGVESVFQTCVPREGKVCILSNGAYGERMLLMLQHARIDHVILRTPEDKPNRPDELDQLLAADSAITHVAIVHSETTTGMINPIREVGQVAAKYRKTYIVDAMSSFAAIPIDLDACAIHFLISSANKCIEGVPGFSFVLCRRDALTASEGHARSLSLNLLDQLRGFEKNAQFRYTPPTHSLLAFEVALAELELEGGIAGRAARYERNHQVLVEGMTRLGFKVYLDARYQGYLITSFHFPTDPAFTFQEFYRLLSEKGFIIYPGKISQADTFRIANIGRLFEADIRSLTAAVAEVIDEMGLGMDSRSVSGE